MSKDLGPQLRSKSINVDVLIICSWKCQNDPRIAKLIARYSTKTHLTVGVVCLSQVEKCARISTASIFHESLDTAQFADLNTSQRLMSLLKLSRSLRKKFRPRFVHGVNLDGFIIGKSAYASRKVVFDQFDSWGTMSGSVFFKLAEQASILFSSYFLGTTKRSIPAWKRKSMLFLNIVSPEVLPAFGASTNRISELCGGGNYLLAGGSYQASRLDQLASIASHFSSLKLIIAGEHMGESERQPNVNFLGSIAWAEWLELANSASGIWAWYESSTEHYARFISPNKYWEACWFGKPIVVNRLSSFCDRLVNEPPVLEIGNSLEEQEQIAKTIEDFIYSASLGSTISTREELLNLERDQADQFKRMLSTMGVEVSSR